MLRKMNMYANVSFYLFCDNPFDAFKKFVVPELNLLKSKPNTIQNRNKCCQPVSNSVYRKNNNIRIYATRKVSHIFSSSGKMQLPEQMQD